MGSHTRGQGNKKRNQAKQRGEGKEGGRRGGQAEEEGWQGGAGRGVAGGGQRRP